MPTNVDITILMDAEMKQLAAVKDSAKDVRKGLEDPGRQDWLKFVGANGREIHLHREVYTRISAINEVIVEQEDPSAEETPEAPAKSKNSCA